ncbi:MAG TPA: tRNA (adenosine(37)-N6)-dimethylallyltransferase MiaA [Candidatus Aerophobetes bacterium]|uniref:tRNA dimethylallyltransferase n=1 Tax=Aerophobetes bacterium TaxID=2030807 RepID=A0A7V0MZX8_UNCAE|nr:tRNA (adenosine(37)-N6)-dimethylallyltransferase MiaA [Candidatus Aerophobetes bacterium]
MLDGLLIIAGPTGTGKTKTALLLLNRVKAEIISADSRQIYRGMDIGTDKVSRKIRKKYPHHLIDIADPGKVFTVADFKKLAEAVIKDLQEKNKLPIVVGGSGLYIKAITSGIFPGPGANWQLRKRLLLKIEKEGLQNVYTELKRVDPLYASKIHPNDKRRLIRALEVYYLTGKPISEHQGETYPYKGKKLMVGLRWRERSTLYKVIEDRVDRMIEKGLVEEVKDLLGRGYDEDLPAMQALGYRQIVAYLKGKVSFDEAIRLIKRDTRRFAKRQLTWFKKEKDIIWLDREDYPSLKKLAEKIITILLQEIPQVKEVLK